MNMKKENIKDMYRLSPMQEGIMFHSFLDPETTAYFQQFEFKIEGTLDIDLFRRSFDLLVERHDILRTTFVYEKVKRPLQIVFKSWPKELQFFDLSGMPETQKAAKAEQLKKEDLERRFDLSKDHLIRIAVVQTDHKRYTIRISYHHILMDGWCIGIISQELFSAYEALKNGQAVNLGESYPFSKYVSWLDRQDMMEASAFWQEYLKGYDQTAIVPQQHQPQQGRYVLKEHRLSLGTTQTEQLNTMARKYGITLNVLMQTVWGVLLQKYNQTDDVVFGAVVSGRPADLPGIEQTVGLFINTVPVRIRCDETVSFEELLFLVHRSSVAMKKHEHFPLHEAQRLSELKQQLIQHILLFQNYPVHEIAESANADLGFRVRDASMYEQTNYDFELIVEPGAAIGIVFRYNAAVYEEMFIEGVAGHLVQVIGTVLESPDCRVRDLQLLSSQEKRRIIVDFNSTELPIGEARLIHLAFEEQAAKTPNSIAVEGRESLTFGELNRKANQLAQRLRLEGVKPGKLVGLLANPAEELVIGMLAILKAGGAYLPIDPQFPPDRIAYMLEDSGTQLLLTQIGLASYIPGDATVIEIDREELYRGEGDNLPPLQSEGDLAYVIYTSGSTGQPKGVMVSHRNVIHFFAGMDQRVKPADDDVMLAVTTISFDISVLELLWTLTRGISIVLHGKKGREFDYFDRYLDEYRDTSMDFSLFFFSSYDNKHKENKYQLLLDMVKYADQNGFSAVWTPERHFHSFGGLYPNPSVTSAALAMVTERLQLRSGSVVAPLHNTLRIAEEWAVVDNLSGGRAGVSFTAGWHQDDFALNPKNYEQRHEVMFQQIEEVRRLWRGESVPVSNGLGSEIEVRVYPEPVQPEIPIWITTSGSRDTIIGAGQIGAHLLTHLLGQDVDSLAENIALYRKTLTENGFSADHGKVVLMLHTFIGEDLEAVKQTVKEPFCDYLRSSLSLIRNLADALNMNMAELQTEEAMQTLLDYGFDRYWQTAALLGTLESCKEMVGRLSRVGVDEIACLIDFGVGHNLVMEGLEKLSLLRQSFEKPSGVPEKTGNRHVTMLQCTPSRLRSLIKDPQSQEFLRSLRTIMVGGEPFPMDLAEKLGRLTTARILNMYGPTETTVWSATYEIPPQPTRMCVGTPIANTQIYLLDPHGNPVPVGVAGELYIGGEGVTQGYLNRPELTAERFLPNSFTGTGRMYRTGDIGRYLPDGNIEIFGRRDDQLKVRGYRMEAGEIEAVLLRHDSIREAAVMVQEEESGEKTLVAYVTWKYAGNEADLRAFASSFLPYYMLPAQYIGLESMPLTPNGKADRKALRRLEHVAGQSDRFLEPTSEIEIVMARIWRQVLGLENIGIHDNFFKLGGDSISALQISSQLHKYDYRMDMKHLFQHPTIAELSKLVHTSNGKRDHSQPVEGLVPLTPIQHWFLEQNLMDAHHYNHAVVLRAVNCFDPSAVQCVLEKIVFHHDALRIVFRQESGDGSVKAINRPTSAGLIELRVTDLRGEDRFVEKAEAEFAGLQSTLNLTEGPLFLAALVHTDDGDHLMLVIHHLLVDGVSWRVLIEDFTEGYRQILRGEDIRFPNKTDSFQTYALRLAEFAKSEALMAEKNYWKQLGDFLFQPLPRKNALTKRSAMNTSRVAHLTLSQQETQQLLQEIHHAYNTEINDILLAALGYAVKEWTGSPHLLFDLEGHGREPFVDDLDVTRTVGWFTSVFPVALDMSKSENLSDQIKRVKENLRRIPGKGLGYGVLKYLTPAEKKCEISFDVQPEIMFNYLGQFDQSVPEDLFELSSLSAGPMLSPASERRYALLINGIVRQKTFTLSFDYSSEQFEQSDIDRLVESYHRHLLRIMNHCLGREQTELTPNDLQYKGLTIEELDELSEEIAASITEIGDKD
ncbi:MupA/Atu3671 family FMN-dependent luciferase-like monooxygenase [Paenibacillus sp. NAIST15-1]|uniref:MupA/Atu3671 family FMN-dependent luciferase-like monooxygenase n=1 Tax=Paenibacillus sp. NAIST15-1 TaxID=1605994 RepID=UPI00086AB793|nr:MupA/Atu3671 family FMN-dependent luciferase-like monooxygenase [Paenibacillus sp. NAIST15-1]GAV12354.1 gramicidin S synthase 1 domain protein [Paenibacillus sp. NAIST15-1]